MLWRGSCRWIRRCALREPTCLPRSQSLRARSQLTGRNGRQEAALSALSGQRTSLTHLNGDWVMDVVTTRPTRVEPPSVGLPKAVTQRPRTLRGNCKAVCTSAGTPRRGRVPAPPATNREPATRGVKLEEPPRRAFQSNLRQLCPVPLNHSSVLSRNP